MGVDIKQIGIFGLSFSRGFDQTWLNLWRKEDGYSLDLYQDVEAEDDETDDVAASISRRPDTSGTERTLINRGDEVISQAESVCVDLDIDMPILERVLDLAQRHGKNVYSPVTNIAIACERRNLLDKVSCLVCNQQESGVLFSSELGGVGDVALPRDGEKLAQRPEPHKILPSLRVGWRVPNPSNKICVLGMMRHAL